MITIDDKVIGRHIQAAREKKNMSQAQLATLLDISTSYMSRVECGRNRINLEKLMEISAVLGIHYSEILEGCSSQSLPTPSSQISPTQERLQQLSSKASPATLEVMCELCETLYRKLDCRE